MMWFWLCAATLGAVPKMAYPGQAIRRIELNPAEEMHKVEVVGGLNMLTTLQLPDDFQAINVRCGTCTILGADTQADSAQQASDGRLWAIEVRPQERNVHLRPTRMPSAANPPALFSTNVFITLDNGQAITVLLRLWDPARDATTHPDADAVVTLRLPHTALVASRLDEQKMRLEKEQARQSALWAQHWLLEHWDGGVTCKKISFAKPYRTDKTVVRIRMLCQAKGPQTHTYWAFFNVENDGATPLVVQDASLEPQHGTEASIEAIPAYFSGERLAFAEELRGIAVYVSPAASEQPGQFRLRVTPTDTQRRPVDIADIVFP